MSASTAPMTRETTTANTLLAVLAATVSVWLVLFTLLRVALGEAPASPNLLSILIYTPLAGVIILAWVAIGGHIRSFLRGMIWTTMVPIIAMSMLPALPQFMANRWCDRGGRNSIRVYPMWRWLILWPLVPFSLGCNAFLDSGYSPVIVTKVWWTCVVVLLLAMPNFTEDDPRETNRSVKMLGRRGGYAWILLLLGIWVVVINIPGYVSESFPKLYNREYIGMVAVYLGAVIIAGTFLSAMFFNYEVEKSITTADNLMSGEIDTHTTWQFSLSMVVENPLRFALGFCATLLFVEHEGSTRYAANVFFSRGTHRRINAVRKKGGRSR